MIYQMASFPLTLGDL